MRLSPLLLLRYYVAQLTNSTLRQSHQDLKDVHCKETGLPDDSPILIYYENDVPFLYNIHPLDPEETDETLKWLIEQRNTAAIEEVTDAMLEDIIDDNEYVAVLFTGRTQEAIISKQLVKYLINVTE